MDNTTTKILVLTANPKSISRLRLDEEVRDIQMGLQRSKLRDRFELITRWAVRPRDIQRAMLDVQPHIVHFSGHGAGEEGLIFEDETGSPQLVDGEALARLFDLFSARLKCVILNGCYSEIQAKSISVYIDYVIGMKREISDLAAIEFAVGFYDALGAGQSVEFAYKLACASILLAGIPENLTPILLQKGHIEAKHEEKSQDDTKGEKQQTKARGVKIFYSYSHQDEELRDTLERHLSVLKRQGLIESWHDRMITPGDEWAGEIDHNLDQADIILLLVSADFIASDYCWDIELKRALDRHEAGDARVIPVILRPVDWLGAPFGKLQALPRNAQPITTWENTDLAFSDVARGIRLVCEEFLRGERIREVVHDKDVVLVPEIEEISAESEIFQLFEVFKTSGVPTITFVEPEKFYLLKLALRQPGVGIVIEGPSGIGKTTALRKALEEVNLENTGVAVKTYSARNPQDLSTIEAIRQWHRRGLVVVDDFHRLDDAIQDNLVDYLKYLADNELPKKIVIIGIPNTGKRLVKLAADVAMRVRFFKLGRVSDEIILKMIRQGELALNIVFDRKTEIARSASGSLNIAQFLCYHLAAREGIFETQRSTEFIDSRIEIAISEVINNELALKFEDTARCFASLDSYKEITCIELLKNLAQSRDGFLSLRHIQDHRPEFAQGIDRFIEEEYITTLYRECPESESYLLYDHRLCALIADDPQFTFYLANVSVERLRALAGKSLV
jgi:hypothetical protein